jgi:hypothetical protein
MLPEVMLKSRKIQGGSTKKGLAAQIPPGMLRLSPFDPLYWEPVFFTRWIDGLYARHFSGLQGAGAHINAFRLAVHQNANFLHVDSPSAFAVVVGVRNMIAGSRFFSCNEAFASHSLHLPIRTLQIPHYHSINEGSLAIIESAHAGGSCLFAAAETAIWYGKMAHCCEMGVKSASISRFFIVQLTIVHHKGLKGVNDHAYAADD